jgi:hypothetical protein
VRNLLQDVQTRDQLATAQGKGGHKNAATLYQGANVMLTIFGNFANFRVKKMGAFLENQCNHQYFALTSDT